jgi:SAM-dependent methyltransferase
MAQKAIRNPSLMGALRRWWAESSARDGFFPTLKRFASLFWGFLRDSTPARRRQRYGDVDYDWDYRVDTTSATIGWCDRLLGLFHSPYQATDPALFCEMLSALTIDSREFTFIDIGSGKGRVLLMAADYPFRRIVGIELLPQLHRTAQENIAKYKSDSQQCLAIESICGDARNFAFPPEPAVVYLFDPLPEAGLVELLRNLERSLREHPRPVVLLYHNPRLEHLLASSQWLTKLAGTEQYSIFAASPAA